MKIPRIWPGPALARALLLPAILSLLIFVSDAVQPVVIVLDLLVGMVAIADLASLRGAGRFRVVRECETTCSLGEPQQVILTLENTTRRDRRLRLCDDVPAVFTADPAEFRVDVPARSRVELEYRLVPGKRGTYAFEQVDALVLSRLGLWQRSLAWPSQTVVRVYPDVRQISRYTMLARRDRLSVLGLRPRAGWERTTSSND